MTAHRQALGRIGEQYAVRYLKRQDYEIVDRNVRLPRGRGEIDIVALQGETYVFVEVRTRRSMVYGTPLESVDFNKRQRLIRNALRYMTDNRLNGMHYRIDIIGLHWPAGKRRPVVEHVENAIVM